MKHIAIIYHDADFDGKLSNEVCRFHLRRLYPDAAIHSYGWDYGRPVPLPEIGPPDEGTCHPDDPRATANQLLEWRFWDAIYIVDLSVDELMGRPELRDKIVWIDHHKSAIEKWEASISGQGESCTQEQYDRDVTSAFFKGIRIDGVAACRLCWHWFTRRTRIGVTCTRPVTKEDFVNRYVEEPKLIRLAGEYDIWDHRDPDAKVLQFGLRSLSESDFHRLVEQEFRWSIQPQVESEPKWIAAALHAGHAIKSYVDKQADEYSAAFAHTIKWEGLTFCALNIGQRGNSDLLRGGLKLEHDACFAWRFDGSKVLVSLYHIEGKTHHDLSLIAVKYGGGGHKGACGFRITLGELETILKGN
jgi:hypothetical protein